VLLFCWAGSRPVKTTLVVAPPWTTVSSIKSQPRDAGSANRDRTAALANPSAASQSADQRTSATNRQRRNPHNV
jgi:hypothetical protein